MISANSVPSIPDPSGALASRFIFLKLTKSFLRNEDIELGNKLMGELSGILRLAIQHWQNLLERKEFVQPKSGQGSADRMLSLSSPHREFVRQLQPYMTKDEIWSQWFTLCFNEGRDPGPREDLWNDLETSGYNCDFDTADIMAKIRQHGGEANTQNLRDCTFRFRQKGGTEILKRKLQEMVKAGHLIVRMVRAVNGAEVEYYSISNEVLAELREDDAD